MEELFRKNIQESLTKSIQVFDMETKQFITNIETTFDLKENMVLNFSLSKSRAAYTKASYTHYETIIKQLELNAEQKLDRENETLCCYVDIISKKEG